MTSSYGATLSQKDEAVLKAALTRGYNIANVSVNFLFSMVDLHLKPVNIVGAFQCHVVDVPCS